MAHAEQVGSSAMLDEHVERRALMLPTGLQWNCRQVIWLLTRLLALVTPLAACTSKTTEEGAGPVGPVGAVEVHEGAEEGVLGSGDIATATRGIGDFDRLVFSSEGTVILNQAEAVSLSIEADDNLHQYLTTDVSDGELAIATVRDTDIAPSEPAVFRVGVVDLTRIELAGAGTITAASLDGTAVEVVLSGTGDLMLDQLQADEVTVGHSGVGTIRLKGEADQQKVVVSGVGEYDGAGLVSRKASVEASGSGLATVHVTDELEITASDSGEVAFYDSPGVEQTVSGLGKVTPLGAR